MTEKDPFASNEDVLNPSYRLLSSVPRSPRATLFSRHSQNGRTNQLSPGPGTYNVGTTSNRVGPRWVSSSTESLKLDSEPAAQFYDIPPPQKKGISMSSRWKEPGSRELRPGPGAYSSSLDTFGPGSQKPRDAHTCTFGLRHHTGKRAEFPGPGTYTPEGGIAKDTAPSPRKKQAPTLKSIPKSPRAVQNPGPGEYNIPSTFSATNGKGVTIKGRLEHPMCDKNAAHEAARTSSPRNPQHRLKAIPRVKL